MKAIAKTANGAGLQLVDVPRPSCTKGSVLIRPKLVSICGSDLHIHAWDDPWTRTIVTPVQVVGHEFVGEVIEVGQGVTGIAEGDLVTGEGHLFCDRCDLCRMGHRHMCGSQELVGFDYPGVFAEIVTLPGPNVISVAGIDEEIACLLDPFGNAVHALSKTDIGGRNILVMGCGPMGLMTLAAAKYLGPNLILAVDRVEARLKLAHGLGATVRQYDGLHSLQAWVSEVTQRKGVDVCLDMSGDSDALCVGCALVKSGGEAVILGLPNQETAFDFANLLVAKELTLKGVVGREIYRTWGTALAMVRANSGLVSDLKGIITHRFMMDDFDRGFQCMFSRLCGKVLLNVGKQHAGSQPLSVACG